MPVAENLSEEELTLFEGHYEELMFLELKIFKLSRDKLYGINANRDLQQVTNKVGAEYVKVVARSTMQTCLQKVKNCNNSSRAVDVALRLSLDFLKRKLNHLQEVQLQVVEKGFGTIEKEIEILENKQIKFVNVLHEINHPKRANYLLVLVQSFAENVAKVLAIDPVDDDELKVALCTFELYYRKLDLCSYEILEQKLSKGRVPAESVAYRKMLKSISSLKTFQKSCHNSYEFRLCLRTFKRLTNGDGSQIVDVRLMMLIQHKWKCIRMVEEKVLELSFITDLSINKEELVTAHERFLSKMYEEMLQLEDMLNGLDDERRAVFNVEIFEEVTTLNDEEIQLLDKESYNEDIHDKRCPVCLGEHSDGELVVSLKCPCKRERLCQYCASKAMKGKSQCPCCRAHV